MTEENNYLDMDLLRFTTAGSVDDGKSTLIGRLFHDTKAIFEDQLEAIERSSKKRGDENVNLALLTDGLRAEREQGITIDVAYRYFATPKRKFIIADTPGHIQYTRNMVTGASTANLALILVDARNGVVEQTRRHTFIADLLGIKHVAVCINKMDLVGYDEKVYQQVQQEYRDFASRLKTRDRPDLHPDKRLERGQRRRQVGKHDLVRRPSVALPFGERSRRFGCQSRGRASPSNGSFVLIPTNIMTFVALPDGLREAYSRWETRSRSFLPAFRPRFKRSFPEVKKKRMPFSPNR